MPLRMSRHIIAGLLATLGVAGCWAQSRSDPHERSAQYLHGRHVPAVSAARALDAAKQQHLAMLAQPETAMLNAAWTPVGPAQVASQQFGAVTGRVTALAIDPADASGNTIYVGTTGGGVWKSTNAAGPASAVIFSPLTDTLPVFTATGATLPSLSIGSLAIANGVMLAGTGDPNDATDSYYGAGILRSADGGLTWTLAQQSADGVTGNHSFFGLSVAGLAFSSANPSLVVAAFSQAAEATLVNAVPAVGSTMGLYWSSDAGVTWHMGSIMDGSQTVQTAQSANANAIGNAATSVVWNAARQSFYAAVQYHGYYQSADGVTWTRLANQPGTGLTATACPPNPEAPGSPSCPIFRGVLAVQPVTGDTFALTVDSANRDQGLYRDACALSGSACGNASVSFGTALNASPLEQGSGSTVIAQADYNLSLAAVPSGMDTLVFAGTTDLYRCSLAAGCTLRNTTNAENGCTNTALVAPSQHAIAALASGLVYLGNDGGLWRSTDAVAETGSACALTDASHFQNLNTSLGSLAEVVSFAQAPADAGTLLAGLGALGTAGTSAVTNSWTQLAAGEGGTVAIDPANPLLWYLSTGAGVSIARCAKGSSCTAADFATTAIGSAQVASDIATLHAPWLLDPGLTSNLITGTCRTWRGPATGGSLWSSTNELSRPFATPAASTCGANAPVVRSLAAGGAVIASTNAQNAGSAVLYAGMAGALDGGAGLGGHLFVTTTANTASGATVWTDVAKSPVTNDPGSGNVFNVGGFDVSSVTVDAHDATGATVYATVMGFSGNGIDVPHLYRSVDAGAHWTNIASNLPNAPANSVVVDPNDANTLYIALDSGVYVTTQVTNCAVANCWSIYGTSLPNAPIVQLLAAPAMPTGDGRSGELRAATYGRGIWQIPLLTAAGAAAPAISTSPTLVTYSPQQVGTESQSVTVTITNSGNAALAVSGITASGDFSETDSCAGTTLAVNGTCTVQASFLPTATGTRAGLLTVYGNVAGGQATVSLSGIGLTAATIVLTPTTLAFPATSVGATSAVENITISNTGGSAATLQTAAITGDFAITANTCSTSLAASTGCTVSIVFAATASGSRSGTLTVVDSAGTQVATLAGNGTNPATDALSPLALVFGAQQLNTASATQQLTLTNAGDVALTQIAAQIASGDFVVLNNCGNSLNAHSSCSFSVTYLPKSVGLKSGLLTISDQFHSQTVALSGTGLAPPGVSLSPTTGLSFAATGAGLVAAAQAVTLTNNGGVALSIASVTVSGDYAVQSGSNTCGATLAPAGVCTVQIVFAPTVAGTRSGTVTFTDNAPNSPQVLPLTGVGVDFSLTSNGASSMTISNGQSATYGLLLGSAAGQPGSAVFTCAGVPVHAICTVNPSIAALGGSSNVSVTVATGQLTGELRLPWTKQLVWLACLVPLFFLKRRRVALMLLLVTAGCGAGRTLPETSVPGSTTAITPSGTYTIVVAGSSAGLVRSVNLTLVVQ